MRKSIKHVEAMETIRHPVFFIATQFQKSLRKIYLTTGRLFVIVIKFY